MNRTIPVYSPQDPTQILYYAPDLRYEDVNDDYPHGLDIRNGLLDYADLTGVNARRINGEWASLYNTRMRETKVSEICNFFQATATGADFTGIEWDTADIREATFDHACFYEARVDRFIANKTSFRDTDFRGAVLRGAKIRRSILANANLRGADLTNANLRCSDFRGADLREAILDGASLNDADLRGAMLTGAQVNGTDFRGAKLGNACIEITIRNGKAVVQHVSEAGDAE